MTSKDLRVEIQKVLENAPENALQEIFDYLKSIEGKSREKKSRGAHLKVILAEDKSLLDRLAQ